MTGARLAAAACHCRNGRPYTCVTCAAWRALWLRLVARVGRAA